jgi:hypothetical protein
MEGRRSRSKPHEQGKVDNNINNIVKVSPPPQAAKSSSAGRMAVMHHVETVQAAVAVDDRFVPIISGENKRKRAPRGPPGRNLKAKTMGSEQEHEQEQEHEHEHEHEEAKPNSLPIGEHHQQMSASHSDGGVRDSSHGDMEDNHHTGFDNGEVLYENGDEGSNAKDLGEKRRGSSRLRIRPSKFRESFPTSSAKVKLELKNGEDPARALEIVLPINSIISPVVRPKEDLQTVSKSPQALQQTPDDVPVGNPTKKKESKTKPSIPVAVKEKGPSTSASLAVESSEAAGLKAILLVNRLSELFRSLVLMSIYFFFSV